MMWQPFFKFKEMENTITVKFLQPMAGRMIVYSTGEEHDLPEAQVPRLVEEHIVEIVPKSDVVMDLEEQVFNLKKEVKRLSKRK